MPVLSGLPQTTGEREVDFFTSFAAAYKSVRNGRAVMASDDFGAISLWVDDRGIYRGEVSRHLVTIDSFWASSFAKMKPWITKWRKQIGVRP